MSVAMATPSGIPMSDASPTRSLPDGRIVPGDLDEALIRAVVHAFYEEIRRDALIGPIFLAAIPDDHWPRHLATMVDFWSSVLLGTRRYDGRPLPRHVALPGLGDDHFVRWLALFAANVRRLASPASAALFVDRAERVAQSFRLGIAFAQGEDTTRIAPLPSP